MMADQPARVTAREIADFLAALKLRRPFDNDGPGRTGEDAALLAWKASLLDRMAARTEDPETRATAAAARADLAAARAELAADRAEALAESYVLRTGGEH
ncbi:hypothetical protein [Nocardiopsis composta]|uniref:Uncharacterized protein n=1 Tax=Nocardiopsis composta TaxID=157465 RepID=A0A7W8QN53_9ACTN|nr:hypothetical protein [Nocardiopsis composta]MBB5433507.1 hypothetical protein [Nocardiopsis composta]